MTSSIYGSNIVTMSTLVLALCEQSTGVFVHSFSGRRILNDRNWQHYSNRIDIVGAFLVFFNIKKTNI